MAAEGPESVSAELAGPVSAPTHSLPAGSPPSSGSHGVSGSAGPSQVGVSALGYPSGLAGPLDSSAYSGGQMSLSLATGIAETAQLEQSSYSTSRQPPATAVAETGAAEDPTILWQADVFGTCSVVNTTTQT